VMLPEQGTTRSEHIFIRLSVQNKHSEFGIAAQNGDLVAAENDGSIICDELTV
jgi:hypothetical protein